MQQPKIILPWVGYQPCPCLSGKIFAQCCRGRDGAPRAKAFDLGRPANLTGHDKPGCYLSGKENCGEKLTIEHPISRNILEQWDNLAVRGFPGTDGTVDVIISPAAAGMRVLCDLHNSDLALLDEHAGRVVKELREIVIPMRHPQDDPLRKWIYVDGPMLSAWSVKLIAAHQAKGTFTQQGRSVKCDADWSKISAAILRGEFEEGAGLFICSYPKGNEIDGVQFDPLVSSGWLVGVHVRIIGFSFITIFDMKRAGHGLVPPGATYRGSVHQLYAQGGDAVLYLAWRKRAELRSYSRGRLEYSQWGSSSMGGSPSLNGRPEIDLRAKIRPSVENVDLSFAPRPKSPVVPRDLPVRLGRPHM
jgi:hypothetical protein